jgi:hypothetical protein
MSTNQNSNKAICRNGGNCAHNKLGTCKFSHSVTHVPQKPVKQSKSVGKKTVEQYLSQAKSLVKKRKDVLAQKRIFEMKYVGVDSKGVQSTPYDDTLKLVESELKAITTEMGMAFGNREIDITLPYEVVFNSDISSGVVNGVTSIDPTNASDFSAAAVLFSEFKCKSFMFEFVTPGIVSLPTPLVFSDSALILAYSPIDDNAFISGGTTAAINYENHRLYAAEQKTSGATSTHQNGACYKFEGAVPDGIVTATAGAIAAIGAGNWQATNVTPALPYGFVKAWSTAGVRSAATLAVAAIVYTHCKFRIRV